VKRWAAPGLSGFLFLLCWTVEASAETPAEAAKRWGLPGNWKVDCAAPISSTNWSLTYAIRQGKLFQDRDNGQAHDSVPMPLAVVNPDGSMRVRMDYEHTLEVHWIKDAKGRVRALDSQIVETGAFVIRNGKFVNGGNDSLWQTRCY
jgi:hypothetical protein